MRPVLDAAAAALAVVVAATAAGASGGDLDRPLRCCAGARRDREDEEAEEDEEDEADGLVNSVGSNHSALPRFSSFSPRLACSWRRRSSAVMGLEAARWASVSSGSSSLMSNALITSRNALTISCTFSLGFSERLLTPSCERGSEEARES